MVWRYAPPPPGYCLARENTLGELGLRTLLEGEDGTAPLAEGAASGWLADRYRVYRHERTGELALAWVVVFETDEGARAFHEAYGKLVASRALAGEGHRASVRVRESRAVLLLAGPDFDAIAAMRPAARAALAETLGAKR